MNPILSQPILISFPSFAFFSISFLHTPQIRTQKRSHLILVYYRLNGEYFLDSRMQVYDVSFHKGDRKQTWERVREGNEEGDEPQPRGVYSQWGYTRAWRQLLGSS